MTGTRGPLLAIELDGDGVHPAAWRATCRGPGAVFDPAHWRAVARTTEAAGFVLATLADPPVVPGSGPEATGRLEAGTRAAFVAAVTRRIGLAPALDVTTTEPFHLATQLASLDHVSRGRGAWLVTATDDPGAAAAVGAQPLTADQRRQETLDVVDVARALWDSWEDDAVVTDVATGRYLDADRVHHVRFTGARFSVVGPLITPRPPQGQLVVVVPDRLDVDDRADVVLVAAPSPDAVASRAARARAAGAPRVLVDVEVLLDAPAARAADRLDRLDTATPWAPGAALRHVGSAAALVELVRALVDAGVDGVRFLPAVLPVDLPLLAEQVLPALGAAGPPGGTLREALGLPRPANRFATHDLVGGRA